MTEVTGITSIGPKYQKYSRASTGEASVLVSVPGKTVLVTTEETPPGRYEVLLDGQGLVGMKRFVEVEAR